MKKHLPLFWLRFRWPVFTTWQYLSIFLCMYFGFTYLVNAQTIIWEKKYGNPTQVLSPSTIQTADGGYLIGGYSEAGKGGDKSEAPRGDKDMWIIKLDSQGNKQWDKTYGGNKEDYLRNIIATSDGGYLLGGWSSSDKGGEKSENSKGNTDFWVIKIDAQGKKLWDKTYGGNKEDHMFKMALAPDGGYLLAGNSDSDKSGDKSEDLKDTKESEFGPGDFWVVKIDENGTKLWDKTYGSEYRDYLTSLVISPDGGYLLGGGGGCTNRSCRGFWIVKITLTGEQQWKKKVGIANDYLASVLVTPDGGYLLGGSTDFTPNFEDNQDVLVIKVDAAGNQQWLKTYSNGREGLNVMAPASDGGYLLMAWSWVVKIDEKGKRLWDGTLGGIGIFNSLLALPDNNYVASRYDFEIIKFKWEFQPNVVDWDVALGGEQQDNLTTTIKTSDGGYLAGGYTNSPVYYYPPLPAGKGKNDYLIVKMDDNSNVLWNKRFGGSADDYLNRVIQTRDGGYLLAGSSLSGKSGDKSEASKGNRDYWIIKTDKEGNKEWDKTLGGSGYDELKKVVELTSGEYVLGGYSNSPISGDKSQSAHGGTDYWLVKISKNGTKLWDKTFGGNADETLGSFTETKDGGFLLGGTSLSGKTGDKSQASQGGKDYWIVKTDKEGKLLWEKTLGGSGHDEAYSVGLSQDENVFIAGTSNSGKNGDKTQAGQGGKDYWLVTLDKNGNKLWDKTYGGSQDDELRASTYTMAGHYVLAGSSYSGVSGDKTQASQGESDYWIVEVDTSGNIVFDKRYGGSGQEELRTITQTRDGGLLLGGRSDSKTSGDRTYFNIGSTDYWLVRIYPSTNPRLATKTNPVAPEATTEKPGEWITFNASPNPFQEKLTIRFTLPETQTATVRILDSQGNAVTTLFQEEAKANQTYQLEWQAGKQEAGIYLLQLQTPTHQNTQKLLLKK